MMEKYKKYDGTAFGELLRAADSCAPKGVWEVTAFDARTGERRTYTCGDIMEADSMLLPGEVRVNASILL